MPIPKSVKLMAGRDSNIPTAPLSDFIKAYNEDDNWWWRISCGHHQNLFEAALDWADQLKDERDQARQRVTELEQQVTYQG